MQNLSQELLITKHDFDRNTIKKERKKNFEKLSKIIL